MLPAMPCDTIKIIITYKISYNSIDEKQNDIHD